MPPELRLKLEQEAESARRSLNAEIIDRLQMSVAGERPSGLLINTLALAMARAEKGAAMSTLRAQADLMDAARVSRALVAAVEALQGAGIRTMEGDQLSLPHTPSRGRLLATQSRLQIPIESMWP